MGGCGRGRGGGWGGGGGRGGGGRGACGGGGGGWGAVAVRRLVVLEGRGELTPGHVRMVAGTLGMSERTVRRWLAAARDQGRFGPVGRERFTVTSDVLKQLAFHRRNAAALH